MGLKNHRFWHPKNLQPNRLLSFNQTQRLVLFSIFSNYFWSLEKLWTSPELLRDKTADLLGTKPGDVYAFAIIMHEVFYQTKPYGPGNLSAEEILERVEAKENPPFRPRVNMPCL